MSADYVISVYLKRLVLASGAGLLASFLALMAAFLVCSQLELGLDFAINVGLLLAVSAGLVFAVLTFTDLRRRQIEI